MNDDTSLRKKSMTSSYALPRGSLILVTGANGYIASHVINMLLELGYNIRGTVRAVKPWLDQYFEQKYGKGRFESVVVPALEAQDALSEAMENVSGVFLLASDLSMSTDPHALIPRVVKATANGLAAANKQESVKRVVFTSSSSAALIPQPDVKGIKVDENTWNDFAIEAAWSPSTPADKMAYYVYAASKAQGEREAWNWVKEHKPHFEFNVVVPNANYGKILCPEIVGSTMTWGSNLLNGDDATVQMFPPQWFVNVEDCARLHVIAMLDIDVKTERIFAFAAPFNWTDFIGILRKLRPDNKRLPDPPANEGRDLSEIVLAPRAEQLLKSFFGRPGWIGLEQSIADGIEGRY